MWHIINWHPNVLFWLPGPDSFLIKDPLLAIIETMWNSAMELRCHIWVFGSFRCFGTMWELGVLSVVEYSWEQSETLGKREGPSCFFLWSMPNKVGQNEIQSITSHEKLRNYKSGANVEVVSISMVRRAEREAGSGEWEGPSMSPFWPTCFGFDHQPYMMAHHVCLVIKAKTSWSEPTPVQWSDTRSCMEHGSGGVAMVRRAESDTPGRGRKRDGPSCLVCEKLVIIISVEHTWKWRYWVWRLLG